MSVELKPPTAYEAFCGTLRLRGPTLNLLFEQARVSPDREGDTIARDAFAAAIVSVLQGALRSHSTSLGAPKDLWKRAGPRLAGFSVGQVLTAALDNARHFEEWDVEKAAALQQRRSVKILSAVLGIPLKKGAKHAPFRGSVCWAVLETLSNGGDYRAVEALVREFAAALERTGT